MGGGTYGTVLTIHSWLRWATLLLAILATLNALLNRSDRVAPLPGRWWDVLFMAFVDLQVLFGLMLYFGLSPFVAEGLTDLGAALRTPPVRFWTLEHAGWMTAAVVLVRIGRVLAMNAPTPAMQRLRRGGCFALALAAMLAGIPWPYLELGRPFFRW